MGKTSGVSKAMEEVNPGIEQTSCGGTAKAFNAASTAAGNKYAMMQIRSLGLLVCASPDDHFDLIR